MPRPKSQPRPDSRPGRSAPQQASPDRDWPQGLQLHYRDHEQALARPRLAEPLSCTAETCSVALHVSAFTKLLSFTLNSLGPESRGQARRQGPREIHQQGDSRAGRPLSVTQQLNEDHLSLLATLMVTLLQACRRFPYHPFPIPNKTPTPLPKHRGSFLGRCETRALQRGPCKARCSPPHSSQACIGRATRSCMGTTVCCEGGEVQGRNLA